MVWFTVWDKQTFWSTLWDPFELCTCLLPHTGNILIITIIIILYLQIDQTADVAQTAKPRSVAAAQDGYVVKHAGYLLTCKRVQHHFYLNFVGEGEAMIVRYVQNTKRSALNIRWEKSRWTRKKKEFRAFREHNITSSSWAKLEGFH